MNLNLNFKTLAVLAILAAGCYYGYDLLFADLATGDLSRLMREYRRAGPARQAILKRHILSAYNAERDYETVVRALDNPSSATQALAIEVLTHEVDRRSLPKLTEMLKDLSRADAVKEALATCMGTFGTQEAIPRLVELTDNAEARSVRSAAHHALLRLTQAGAQVKLGDNTREQWDNWLRSRRVTGVR
ncbi:MAG: HEAT repeat domain-containing protein [Planctomycetes bacterium]|nr:HEAT repeat domain-containing protein [Planctomycetota bacterium]